MLVNAGPVMLLEVCEATLKDWLSENRTVTADMLEDILIFALDIARGVEFLHRQQVNSVVFFSYNTMCGTNLCRPSSAASAAR